MSLDELLYKFRWQATLVITGFILAAFGLILYRSNYFSSPQVEILDDSEVLGENQESLIIEVSGSVQNPGVHTLPAGARINDALSASGGLLDQADQQWVSRNINRASALVDGQKIYIPSIDEQSGATSANNLGGDISSDSYSGNTLQGKLNINTASQNQLEQLWGIGPVTAQNIIEQRPYSSVEELQEKNILKSNVYEKNKDLLSVY